MAIVSSYKIRAAIPPEPRLPERPEPPEIGRGSAAALRQMQGETAAPAFPQDVLTGLVRLTEALLIVVAGLACLWLSQPRPAGAAAYFAVMLIVVVPAVTAVRSARIYAIAAFRRPAYPLLRMALGWVGAFAAIWTLCWAISAPFSPPARFLTAWLFVGGLLLILERLALAWLVGRLARAGRLERRIAVVGGGEFAVQLLRDLAESDPSELRLLGVFDDRGDERAPEIVEGVSKLGNVDDLIAFARTARVDLIIFALPITAEARIQQMLRKLCVLPIDIRLAAHANRLKLRPRAYSYVGRAPLLDVFDKPLGAWDIVVKAAFDRIVGALALILTSPVMLLAAIAVKLDSKGPVLFKQKRYGFNNEIVEVYKFRSMYADKLDPLAAKQVVRGDPRVTRVGRFLRRSSIDELPQLFNVVFKGDLSLIGPRPHAMHAKAVDREYDEIVESYFARHRVKPGLTGWAQISGWRGETDTPEKIQQRVEHDLYYIENWSLLFDLRILILTPWVLIRGDNAF